MLLGYDRLRVPYSLSRRSFSKLLAAAPLARAFAGEPKMFLSLNSVLLQGRVHWPDFARLAAQIGFPRHGCHAAAGHEAGVRATNDLLAGLRSGRRSSIFRLSSGKTMQPSGRRWPCSRAAAQFAAAIHCPRMITYILPSSDTPKDELRQTYKQRFIESARILARYHVRLGLEFLGPLELRKAHKYEFIWRMNDMLAFARECGPNVRTAARFVALAPRRSHPRGHCRRRPRSHRARPFQ